MLPFRCNQMENITMLNSHMEINIQHCLCKSRKETTATWTSYNASLPCTLPLVAMGGILDLVLGCYSCCLIPYCLIPKQAVILRLINLFWSTVGYSSSRQPLAHVPHWNCFIIWKETTGLAWLSVKWLNLDRIYHAWTAQLWLAPCRLQCTKPYTTAWLEEPQTGIPLVAFPVMPYTWCTICYMMPTLHGFHLSWLWNITVSCVVSK